MEILDIEWMLIVIHLGKMGTAYVLALPIGWDREWATKSAGLRTFPLVSIATCGFMLIGMEVLDSTDAEARVMEGIITGMGIIGAGAIGQGPGGGHRHRGQPVGHRRHRPGGGLEPAGNPP